MKKIQNLTIILFSILAIFSTSCNKDEDDVSSIANIKVTKLGVSQAGEIVYMFDDNHGPSTSFFIPIFADKQVVTESNGIASFELQEVFDLDVIDSQTTFYFGIFDGDSPIGQTAITIKKGQTKSATISLY